jgi:hypothetical protein
LTLPLFDMLLLAVSVLKLILIVFIIYPVDIVIGAEQTFLLFRDFVLMSLSKNLLAIQGLGELSIFVIQVITQ